MLTSVEAEKLLPSLPLSNIQEKIIVNRAREDATKVQLLSSPPGVPRLGLWMP